MSDLRKTTILPSTSFSLAHIKTGILNDEALLEHANQIKEAHNTSTQEHRRSLDELKKDKAMEVEAAREAGAIVAAELEVEMVGADEKHT